MVVRPGAAVKSRNRLAFHCENYYGVGSLENKLSLLSEHDLHCSSRMQSNCVLTFALGCWCQVYRPAASVAFVSRLESQSICEPATNVRGLRVGRSKCSISKKDLSFDQHSKQNKYCRPRLMPVAESSSTHLLFNAASNTALLHIEILKKTLCESVCVSHLLRFQHHSFASGGLLGTSGLVALEFLVGHFLVKPLDINAQALTSGEAGIERRENVATKKTK